MLKAVPGLLCIVSHQKGPRIHSVFHTYLAFWISTWDDGSLELVLGNVAENRVRFKTAFWTQILQITDVGVCYRMNVCVSPKYLCRKQILSGSVCGGGQLEGD